MADTREANKLIRLCRQHAHVPIRVSPIPLDHLTFVGFGDGGWGMRRDGASQSGSLIIAADKRILDGFEEQRRRWWTGRVTSANVSLLVRLRPMWKHLTCWFLPRCFTLCFWTLGKA